MEKFTRLKHTGIRLVAIAVLALLCFVDSESIIDKETLNIVKFVTGLQLSIALITHMTRILLFPYIDLADYAKSAKGNPIASSIVFFGICLIISVSIFSGAEFFK